MAKIRSQNEIIQSSLDFFKIAQPSLDTKPGSVARDLFIESPATQISKLYDELGRVATLQSLRLALGIDLDRLGDNVAIKRLRGSKSTGVFVGTFSSLDADFSVNKGDLVTARNGATFLVSNSLSISVVNASQYKAKAAQLRSDLDFVGITDTYAVEILVEATSTGVQGNISKFAITNSSISGFNNVTNTIGFAGGRGAEDDAAFRTRILSVFNGANTGTSKGYENVVKADPAVLDVIVIQPGDSLMTRDGTQVSVASDGTRTIISEGTGGKVDVLVYGVRLQETVDTFIYRDLSNTNDPTNVKNDFVLGQILADAGKTVTRKRLDDIAANQLPSQPINNVTQVSGSISGSNFIEETIDSLGRSSGNYKLVRDTGAFGGSAWGFDRLRWTSNKIANFIEDKTKSTFNGQDALAYSDVITINSVTQNISVVNENSKVSASDRTSLQLAHLPITNVTRVFNITTGERYVVINQNPDYSGSTNYSGRIIISGKSLPAISDTLQVDYTWVFSFDPYFDFDNRLTNNNIRVVQDSIDWGYSNAVRRERATLMSSGSYLSITTAHPISSVISVNVFAANSSVISLSSGRLAIVVLSLISNIISVIRVSDGAELWKTTKFDGTFSGLTIFLPTDTAGVFGQAVNIVYNGTDVYNSTTKGSFNSNTITIVPSSTATAGTIVECNYIADILILLPVTLLSSLPAIRSKNTFSISNVTNIGSQPTTHIFSNENVILSNLRQAPSNLALTINGSISPGVITTTGTSIVGVFDVVYTVATTGLKQDLTSALKGFLKLASSASVPSNIRLARVVKVENVTTTSNLEVLSVNNVYDVKGYEILDNSLVKDESIVNTLLKSTEFTLSSTSNNSSHIPKSGDRLRISFYYIVLSDSENISFTKSGTLYTNKRFVFVDTIAISSGFTSGGSSVSTLAVSNLNQPATRSRYKSGYDYTAPKVNERISIKYNFDRLITDSQFAIEGTRPINADVLAKASTAILVNVTMRIGVTDEFINSTNIVLQNVQDVITTALNARQLGSKLDGSDLVNQAYTVNGVDSARIIFFNKNGQVGSVLNIKVQKNEFIQANTVLIQLES